MFIEQFIRSVKYIMRKIQITCYAYFKNYYNSTRTVSIHFIFDFCKWISIFFLLLINIKSRILYNKSIGQKKNISCKLNDNRTVDEENILNRLKCQCNVLITCKSHSSKIQFDWVFFVLALSVSMESHICLLKKPNIRSSKKKIIITILEWQQILHNCLVIITRIFIR